MIKRAAFFTLFLVFSVFYSCETDFSLNGNYSIQPIVFGLLDHNQDVHMIKITKAYLGDGDNLVYAQNPDSSYFNQIDAVVVEFLDGTATGRSWTLHDTVVSNKSTDGIFYAPDQKAYVFYESDLDSTAEYELTVTIDGGAHVVTGRTTLIDRFKIQTATIFNPQYKVQFAPNTVDTDDDYDNFMFTVTEGYDAARYNYKYTIRWQDTYLDLSTQTYSATRNNGDIMQTGSAKSPSAHGVSFSGLDFYQFVRDAVPDDPNVDQRRFLGLDVQIAVAHTDLNQYMEVSSPVTGIAQVQPEFTNLTGARGLFSSRIIYSLNGLQLNAASLKELCTGGYTISKDFCSSYPEHMGETWYCP